MAEEQPPMPDMGALLGMAMEMQQQMSAAQDQAAQTLLEGQAGGGVVRIEVTGGMEFRSVTISPDAVDPDDVEMLQDLILAALHDAVSRVNDLTEEANPLAGMGLGGGMVGGLGGLDVGGLDLSALGLGGVQTDDDDDEVMPDGGLGLDMGVVDRQGDTDGPAGGAGAPRP